MSKQFQLTTMVLNKFRNYPINPYCIATIHSSNVQAISLHDALKRVLLDLFIRYSNFSFKANLPKVVFSSSLLMNIEPFIQYMFICWWDNWKNGLNGVIISTRNILLSSHIGSLWTYFGRFIKFGFNWTCLNRFFIN